MVGGGGGGGGGGRWVESGQVSQHGRPPFFPPLGLVGVV